MGRPPNGGPRRTQPMWTSPSKTEQTTAAAPPSESASKPKKRAKIATAMKKAKTTQSVTQKSAAKRSTKAGDQAPAERGNKKAAVIAMIKRPKGATLAEIVAATGWQKHTVRGFISILANKGGQKIESSKNAA